MKTWLLVLAVGVTVGCKKPPVDASAAERPEPGMKPLNVGGDASQRVRTLLSVRDPEPSCGQVLAVAGDDPVATLVEVVEEVAAPPWVAVRAARCVVLERPDEGRDALVDWVLDPGVPALTRLVLDRLDDLPLEVAVAVVEEGVVGLNRDDVVAAALASERPELVALGEDAPPLDAPVPAPVAAPVEIVIPDRATPQRLDAWPEGRFVVPGTHTPRAR